MWNIFGVLHRNRTAENGDKQGLTNLQQDVEGPM